MPASSRHQNDYFYFMGYRGIPILCLNLNDRSWHSGVGRYKIFIDTRPTALEQLPPVELLWIAAHTCGLLKCFPEGAGRGVTIEISIGFIVAIIQ